MVRGRFPLSAWRELYHRCHLLGLLRWRLCKRLVVELFVAVHDLHGLIQKYPHHHFLFGLGTSPVLLENLVGAVVVPDGPIVVYGTGLLPAEHLRQVEAFGRATMKVGPARRPALKLGVERL